MTLRKPLTSTLTSNRTLASICDGRVRLERLPTSGIISARAWIQGKDIRKSTGERTLTAAKRVATEWWQDLSVRVRRGEQVHSPTFADCATKFLAKRERDAEAGLISAGQYRNLRQKAALLAPLLGSVKVADITADTLERLRSTRERVKNKRGQLLTNETLKKDFVFIHSVLTFARDPLKVLPFVPKTPSFTGTKALVRRGRPFLTEAEYKTLHQLAKSQAEEPDLNPRVRRQRQELYWFILICVGGALRVGEAESVRWCDCEQVTLKNGTDKGEPPVRMLVLGKHSTGGRREDAYVLFGGVYAYREMLAARPETATETDLLFTESYREGMKRLLKDAGLYEYRDPKTGKMLTRDRKSLRPTGITLRLDKGDNLSHRDVAKWARTSVQMVADFYDQAHPEQVAERVAGFRNAKN